MKQKPYIYQLTAYLMVLLLFTSWTAPASADLTQPTPQVETNMEGAPLQSQPTPQGTPTEPVISIAANQSPEIDIWYKGTIRFGHIGNPQERVDILGNVRDPDGSIRSLTYRVNGSSEVSIPIGPDGRRLERPGDFIASIPVTALRSGSNTIVFTATDNSGAVKTNDVTFSYTKGNVWPLPYQVNWQNASSIHSVSQVVDGLWTLTSNGVRTQQVGYDRLIAIGDVSWKNFEVLVPITIHKFYPDPDNPSDAGGVGVITRWQGHTGSNNPPDGWTRLGAYGYYSNRLGKLALRLDDTSPYTQSFNFVYNQTYLLKIKAETVAEGGKYSLKMWESGKPEPSWSDSAFSNIVNRIDSNNDLLQGSMLLVAHRADVTFGDVTICPPDVLYTLKVGINGGGKVSFSPNKNQYQCGEGVKLTATPELGWEFTGWSGDISSSANPLAINMTKNFTLTANFRQAQTVPLNHHTFLPVIQR